jgi:S-adenosylmethionine decarboxylase
MNTSVGTHLILDFSGAKNLTDKNVIEQALCSSAKNIGATLLQVNLHQFQLYGGITGVALLAESHISIHTWPEYEYVALDIFVCGTCNPNKALTVLIETFKPTNIEQKEIKRGPNGMV